MCPPSKPHTSTHCSVEGRQTSTSFQQWLSTTAARRSHLLKSPEGSVGDTDRLQAPQSRFPFTGLECGRAVYTFACFKAHLMSLVRKKPGTRTSTMLATWQPPTLPWSVSSLFPSCCFCPAPDSRPCLLWRTPLRAAGNAFGCPAGALTSSRGLHSDHVCHLPSFQTFCRGF